MNVYWVKRTALSGCVSIAALVLTLNAANGYAGLPKLFVQYRCDVSNELINVTTFDINQVGNGRHPDQRSFDFDSTGITFRRPPIPDAADYSDIKEIRYAVDKGNQRGYLTVVAIMNDGSLDDEKLGYIDEACWNVLSDFLKRKKAKVKLVVTK